MPENLSFLRRVEKFNGHAGFLPKKKHDSNKDPGHTIGAAGKIMTDS
jgi:hypothetical protein